MAYHRVNGGASYTALPALLGQTKRMSRDKLRRWWRAARYLVIEALASSASLIVLIFGVILLPLLVLSGGWLAVPLVVRPLRFWAGLARQRNGSNANEVVESAYSEIPARLTIEESLRVTFSRSTARDLLWLLGHAFIVPIISMVTVALPLSAVNSLFVPAYWFLAPANDPVASPFPVTSWADAAWMPLVAVGFAVLAWWIVPGVAFVLRTTQARALTPGPKEKLADRVTALTASRAAALDAHTSELRRIERDLHDGAQNRLVNVVMMLGIAERSLETNPGEALPQLLRAQDAATDALASLRTMVHDIYPPILDELGLEGALSAVAGRSAVPCTLVASNLRRVPAAVESATYFIVAEALTNVNKYSGASRVIVSLKPTTAGPIERLLVTVEDDGSGGAVERPGGGIAGIRRRIEAFEGTLQIESPKGGPTTMRVELPCGW